MFGRAHLPLILLAAAPCHAQAAPATLTELRRDVAVMLAGAADAAPDPAAVARLCLAARELAATIDPVHGDALLGACSQLTDALLGLSWHGQGLDAARDLHEAYRRAMTRGLLETTTHHRRHAETSLLVGDLATLRAQAKLGQRKNEPESVFERCLLQVLATRLHCQLGRLEQAERHLGDAQKCAVWLQQRIEQDGHAPEPYGAAIRNTIMAAADYHLLTGNLDSVAAALNGQVAGTEPSLGDHRERAGFRPYALVAGMLGGNRDDEQALMAACLDGSISPRMRSLVAPKLVRIALRRGDRELARQRFEQLTAVLATTAAPDRMLRPLASVEMELAATGDLPITPERLARARAAFEHFLADWRGAPDFDGGVGFLHIDDRATILSNYVRLLARATPASATGSTPSSPRTRPARGARPLRRPTSW